MWPSTPGCSPIFEPKVDFRSLTPPSTQSPFVSPSRPPTPPSPSGQPRFQRVFRDHYERVVRAIRRFGVPARYQEDVAQEVFLIVLRALPRYDPSRPFKPWLLTITYRAARDFMRLHRHHLEELMTSELDPQATAPDDPEEQRARRDAEAIFQRIVGALEEDLREVFLMHEVDEISILEIATALGVPASTIASRLRRARKEFDAAVQRLRASEEFRVSGALFLPVALVDREYLLEAGRRLPEVSPEAQARAWGRVMRATYGDGLGALSRFAALTPPQIARALAGAFIVGAVGGGSAIAAALVHASVPPRAPEPAEIRAEVLTRDAGTAEEKTAKRGDVDVPSPKAPALAASTAAARAVAPVAARDAQGERVLLDHARRALAEEHLDLALGDLGKLAEQFPESAFPGEREELRRTVLQQIAARPSAE